MCALKMKAGPSMVVHACNLSIWEAEAGESGVSDQIELYSETVFCLKRRGGKDVRGRRKRRERVRQTVNAA